MRTPTRGGAGLGVAALLAGLLAACGSTPDPAEPATAAADDTIAAASIDRGAGLFQNNCAQCHGDLAQGTDSGPPFIHPVYEPGHHGDEAFQRAAANGVQPHHWDFGAMPPVGAQNGLTREDVADIVAYVRQLQRDAGIG